MTWPLLQGKILTFAGADVVELDAVCHEALRNIYGPLLADIAAHGLGAWIISATAEGSIAITRVTAQAIVSPTDLPQDGASEIRIGLLSKPNSEPTGVNHDDFE